MRRLLSAKIAPLHSDLGDSERKKGKEGRRKREGETERGERKEGGREGGEKEGGRERERKMERRMGRQDRKEGEKKSIHPIHHASSPVQFLSIMETHDLGFPTLGTMLLSCFSPGSGFITKWEDFCPNQYRVNLVAT